MTGPGNLPGSGPPDSGKPSDERRSLSSAFFRRLGERDEQAWRRLAELYGPLVLHWCRRAGLQPDDAADVLQEVFRTVAEKVAGFDPHQAGGTFRGWLAQITRNKLGDYIRRRRREPAAVGGSDQQELLVAAPDDAEQDDSTATREVGGLYKRCFDLIRAEFEEPSWQAFWKTAVEGQPAADVAAVLGTSVNAVYLAKSRILRRLRDELGEE